jgi:serine protease Do
MAEARVVVEVTAMANTPWAFDKASRGIENLDKLVSRASAATVKVRTGRMGNGSGLIAGHDGEIVTNAHVAQRSSLEIEFPDGTEAAGTVIARDPARDLAVVRVPHAPPAALEFADSDTLRPGQIVLSVGNPSGSTQAVAVGVIHAVQRSDQPWRMVVADIRLAPGYSGGPMIDGRGRVVGLNTMVSGGLGLAVPSNHVSAFLAFQRRPKLGVALKPARIAPAIDGQADGLLVTAVAEGSPTARAGVTVGDIVAFVDGVIVRFPNDLMERLAMAGPVVKLGLIRGGKRVTVQVVLAGTASAESSEAA